MGFAILRHGKIKGAGKGVSVAHNHRLATEKTPNINSALTGLNWSAWDSKTVSRINNLLPEKTRKDAVQVVEVLLTASPDFFKSMGESMLAISKKKQFSDWVKASINWAKKEFGKNLVDVVLHMDEATPHLHILSVPITPDGRLCAKEVMARKQLQRRQTEYAAVVAPFGLLRGEAASTTGRIHVPLKSNAKINEEIDALKAENVELKNSVANALSAMAVAQADAGSVFFLKGRNEKIRGELVDAQGKLEKLQDLQVENEALKAENLVLNNLVTVTKSELESVQVDFDALNTLNSAMKIENEGLLSAVEALKSPKAIEIPQPIFEKQPEGVSVAPDGNFDGRILEVVDGYIIQNLGMSQISHRIAELGLSQPPVVGDYIEIKKRDGLSVAKVIFDKGVQR